MRKTIYTLIVVYVLMAFLPVAFHNVPLFRTSLWFYFEIAVVVVVVVLSFSRLRRR